MGSKYTTKLWLLESNEERLVDEFSEPNEIPRGLIQSKKTLLRTKIIQGGLAPDGIGPVALVFEHHYDETGAADGKPEVYASPLFGHEMLRQLEGRLLDYVDATYADIEQRKSQKRILRRILWEFRSATANMNKQKFSTAELVKS